MQINLLKWRELAAQKSGRRFYLFSILLFLIILLVIAITYHSLKSEQIAQHPLYNLSPSEKKPVQATRHKKHTLTHRAMVFALHYANASVLKKSIEENKKTLLKKGWVASDKRTNQLWVYANSKQLHTLEAFIKKLDVPVSEVRIKARIVSVDEQYVHALGIIFGSQRNDASSQNSDGFRMDLPTLSNGAGIANIPIARLQNGQLLDVELAALATAGHATIISSPELVASNRQTASIASGDEVPYQEQSGEGNTSVAFKQALLQLNVTPDIMPKQRILLQLNVHQDAVSGLTVNGVPGIRTQQIKTAVLVHNKETLALGGIYEQSSARQSESIPFLSKIPLLGILFQRKQRAQQRKQLLIFVTPEILSLR